MFRTEHLCRCYSFYIQCVISNNCQSLNCGKILISGKQISRTPVWIYVLVKWRDLEQSVNRYSLCTRCIKVEDWKRHLNDWYLVYYPNVWISSVWKQSQQVDSCIKHKNTDVNEWMYFKSVTGQTVGWVLRLGLNQIVPCLRGIVCLCRETAVTCGQSLSTFNKM